MRQTGIISAFCHELRIISLERLQSCPEQFFGHVGIARQVGMGKSVAAWRRTVANLAQVALMVLKRIADVIQAKRMGKLRIHHRYHMACRTETPGLDFVFPSQRIR